MAKYENAKDGETVKEYLVIPQILYNALLQIYRNKNGEWDNIKKAAENFNDNITSNNMAYNDAREILGKSTMVIEKDLGFLAKGESEYLFDDSVFALAVDSVSQKYEESDGIHFYKIEDAIQEMDVVKVRDIILVSNNNFEKAFQEDIKNLNVQIYIK